MNSSANKKLVAEFKGGNDDVVSVAARKFFPSARKFLRMKGVRDKFTPQAFADSLVAVLLEIRRNKVSELADFNGILNSALGREAEALRSFRRAGTDEVTEDTNADVAAQCVSVLDAASKQLLYLRYGERKSFEEIAAILNFSNPVIAQFEVEKAYRQLEGIVKVRFNMSPN